MIRCVISDVGKVIILFDNSIFFRKIACWRGLAGCIVHGLLPPGGRLSHEAYNAYSKLRSLQCRTFKIPKDQN